MLYFNRRVCAVDIELVIALFHMCGQECQRKLSV